MASVAAANLTLSPSSPPSDFPVDVLLHEEGDTPNLTELAVIPTSNDGTSTGKECKFQYEGRPCQLCKDEPIPDDPNVLQVPNKDTVVLVDLTDAPLSQQQPQEGCCNTTAATTTVPPAGKTVSTEEAKIAPQQEEEGASKKCCASQATPIHTATIPPSICAANTVVCTPNTTCRSAPPPMMGPLAAPASLCTPKSGVSVSTSIPVDVPVATAAIPVVVGISYEHVAKDHHQGEVQDESRRGDVQLTEAMEQLAAAMALAGNQSNIRAIQFGQTSNFTDVTNCKVVGPPSSFIGTATEFVYALNDQCNALVDEVLTLRKLFAEKTVNAVIDARPSKQRNAPVAENCTNHATATIANAQTATTTRSYLNIAQPQDNHPPKRPRTDDYGSTITTTALNNC